MGNSLHEYQPGSLTEDRGVFSQQRKQDMPRVVLDKKCPLYVESPSSGGGKSLLAVRHPSNV